MLSHDAVFGVRSQLQQILPHRKQVGAPVPAVVEALGRQHQLVLVTERAKLLKDSRYYRWPQRSTSHFSHSPCGAFAESRRLVPEHLDLFPSDRGTQDWIATRMGIAWKCGNCTPFTWPRSAFKMLNMSVGGG